MGSAKDAGRAAQGHKRSGKRKKGERERESERVRVGKEFLFCWLDVWNIGSDERVFRRESKRYVDLRKIRSR